MEIELPIALAIWHVYLKSPFINPMNGSANGLFIARAWPASSST